MIRGYQGAFSDQRSPGVFSMTKGHHGSFSAIIGHQGWGGLFARSVCKMENNEKNTINTKI